VGARAFAAAALVAVSAPVGWSGLPDADAAEASVVHDIPADVIVRAFVRPEGRQLTFLVRVPLESMRDIDFPLVEGEYLDIPASEPLLRHAAQLWLADYVTFREDGVDLGHLEIVATRISLPSDRSFATYAEARAHVQSEALPAATRIPRQHALFDVYFRYAIESPQHRFSVDPAFAHLGLHTVTILRFQPPGRAERAFEYTGDPGLVRLDPSWFQAARRFVQLGFWHILHGIDHLLFLLCLVAPLRSVRALVPVITSFTIAHSITLIAAASGIAPHALWFPPLIEVLIAVSIVFMALENIVGAKLSRRWALAFGFGLVHGFGFSFALSETFQFAGAHLITSLLSFNVGVELGQLLVVMLTIPVLQFLFGRVVPERMGVILLSAILAHSGWHWMTARVAALRQYQVRWPAFDAALLASLMRWTMLALIVGGAAWMIRTGVRRGFGAESERL